MQGTDTLFFYIAMRYVTAFLMNGSALHLIEWHTAGLYRFPLLHLVEINLCLYCNVNRNSGYFMRSTEDVGVFVLAITPSVGALQQELLHSSLRSG